MTPLRQLRTPHFQPLWDKLHRLSLWGMNIGPAGQLAESGERWVLEQALASNPAGRSFILFDAGANRGQYAKQALSIGNPDLRLHSFEPSPVVFGTLSGAVGSHPYARLFPFGLSNQDSEAILHYHVGGEAEASLCKRDLRHWGIEQSQQVTVRLRRLDEVCESLGVRQIDFLKIDVEGHEISLLEGAGEMLTSGAIHTIQFEFGGPNIESRTYFKDLFQKLNPHYDLFRVVYNGLQPVREYSEFLETFLTVNFLAVTR